MTVTPDSPFRLILDEPANGRWNMAVDEALLESVGDLGAPPTVRLYGFAPATVSFGRFQRIRENIRRQAVEEAGITLVRRPTGGQAVLHDRELTYAVVLGRDHLEPFHKREIYRFIASMLLEGLIRLGIRGQSNRKRSGDLHNPDCFRSTGEYEIASGTARKLIGSAQMINRRASLQHGAIPLDASYQRLGEYLLLPEGAEREKPSCLAAELGRPVGFEEAVKAFAEGFDRALHRRNIRMRIGKLREREAERAEVLLREKYSGDEWNLMY